MAGDFSKYFYVCALPDFVDAAHFRAEQRLEEACRLGIIGIVNPAQLGQVLLFFFSAAAVNFCGNSINFKSQCQLAQWDK